MSRFWIAAIVIIVVASDCATTKTINMTSPDGRIKVAFTLDRAGQPNYSVQYLDTAVITNGSLGLVRKDADFTSALRRFCIKILKTIEIQQ